MASPQAGATQGSGVFLQPPQQVNGPWLPENAAGWPKYEHHACAAMRPCASGVSCTCVLGASSHPALHVWVPASQASAAFRPPVSAMHDADSV